MLRASACAFAMLVAIAITACSLFVDTDGLSGGDDSGGALNDAPIASDANPPRDADLPDGGDAATTPFCASHPGHTLCYDFDESAALPPNDGTLFDTGHFMIDSADSVSPPQSLLMILDAGDSNQQFQKNLTSTQGKVSWAVDLKFSASDLTTGQTAPLATDVPAVEGLSDHYFYLQTYFNSLNIGESASPADGGPPIYTSTELVNPVPVDTWLHVEFTVDGTSGVITVSYNGGALPNNQAQFGFPNGAMQVTVGGFSGDLPVTTKIRLDNVLVDF